HPPARRASVQLQRPRPRGVRPARRPLPPRQDRQRGVRLRRQLVRPQPALPLGAAGRLAAGDGRPLRGARGVPQERPVARPGRPVVTTYVAGIPELVEPGGNGWLVPAGDPTALADALADALAASPEKLATMGRAGAATVRRMHDAHKEAGKLARLFGAEPARQ